MRPDFGPHFLIASDDEAAIGAASIQLDGIDAFAAWENGTHAVGPEQLAELHCLILGRALDYSVLDGYQIVFSHDEMHGPWLIWIPDEFVNALALLDGVKLDTIGERWIAASSGFRLRKAPHEWVQQLGIKLSELARRAVMSKKHMYWEAESC